MFWTIFSLDAPDKILIQSLSSKAARAMIVTQIVELIDLLWELAYSLSALMVWGIETIKTEKGKYFIFENQMKFPAYK